MNLDQLKISVDPATKNVGSAPVGPISADIKRAYNGVAEDRGSESSLGNLVADIQLWATSNAGFGGEPAEIAFMNPGGVRTDLSYGEDGKVTYKEVATVQPFANTLVTMHLTGTQLRAVLEQQWQSSRAKLHLGVSEGFSPGQEITGTLYSTPVNLGTFTANAAGLATFSAVIPANTPVGAHTLVISSVGLEPISLAVTVVAAASTSGLIEAVQRKESFSTTAGLVALS